jgi:hypothetical protein
MTFGGKVTMHAFDPNTKEGKSLLFWGNLSNSIMLSMGVAFIAFVIVGATCAWLDASVAVTAYLTGLTTGLALAYVCKCIWIDEIFVIRPRPMAPETTR